MAPERRVVGAGCRGDEEFNREKRLKVKRLQTSAEWHQLLELSEAQPARHELGQQVTSPSSDFVGYLGNSSVAYLVMQNRNLEYGEPRCGFNTKHQSTQSFQMKADSFNSISVMKFVI